MSNDKLAEALRSLRLKFTSGNDVPVPEARITRAEWEAIDQSHAAEAAQAQAQAAEPVVWMTPTKNYFGSFEGCTDACNGAPIPLYTHPQPAQDAKDASRYRWLRDKSGRAGSPYIRCDDQPFKPMDYWITAGTADSCIDRAMAKESGNG